MPHRKFHAGNISLSVFPRGAGQRPEVAFFIPSLTFRGIFSLPNPLLRECHITKMKKHFWNIIYLEYNFINCDIVRLPYFGCVKYNTNMLLYFWSLIDVIVHLEFNFIHCNIIPFGVDFLIFLLSMVRYYLFEFCLFRRCD